MTLEKQKTASGLLLEIARCSLLKAYFKEPAPEKRASLCCYKTIEFQHSSFKDIFVNDHTFIDDPNKHQLPEPWCGDLENAPILFIGSNPSINVEEDFPLSSWDNTTIEDFFAHRFDGRVGHWINPNLQTLLKSKGYTRRVGYWSKLKSLAEELLEDLSLGEIKPNEKKKEAKPGQDFALTEIVHCKTKKESFVDKQTWQTCPDRYMTDILKLSKAPVLVALGATAAQRMNELYQLQLSGSDRITKTPIKIKSQGCDRYVVFLNHPNARITQQSKETVKKSFGTALSSEQLETLREFLRNSEVIKSRITN